MKLKRFTSLLLSVILIVMSLPLIVYAESYFSLEDIAEANGYEYFYYADKESANLRSASYILAFQVNNGVMSYKTVLGDVGTTALKYEPIMKDGNIHISEYDATTKLVKYFPNTPSEKFSNNSVSVEETTGSLPSDWAVAEVNSAKNNGLTTDAVTEDYQSYITRENFCELVVKLYEKITKKTPSKPTNPFNDTSNGDVLKAYNLGIVKGVSSTSFNPYSNITRQEICAMLVRAISVMYTNIDTTDYYEHYFNDSYEISSWAEDSVQFAYDNDIMQGTGNNCISPLGNTTCEQAILLVNRIYENRSVFDKRNKDSEKALETIKTLTFDEDEEVKSISVSYTDGSSTENIKIKEIKKSDLIYSTTGMKGSAVNITSSDNFDEATITFEYNANELGGTNPNDLAIAWYNTDLNRIEVLESNVNTSANTVSIKTTHFSKYLLVDSKEWYSIWQRGQTIIRETDKNGNNAENFNVQLVVDCSGSMDGNRIATARECTYDFIQKLSPNDRFSVIKFGSNAYTIIPCTEVSSADMNSVKNIVMGMSDGGGTNFDAALTECINTLDFNDKEFNNIIVFLSDGESSVSDSILQTLKNNNIRIASVALGSGTNTSMMKKLSDNTNGQYVYAEDSSDLDAIYSAIQGSLIGVDATDTDGDGIPDMIEITGMKNQYGDIIRTDPNKADTDGDGKSDGEEMGSLVENGIPTEMDKKNGITSCVYFEMKSDPVEGTEVDDNVNVDIDCSVSIAKNIDDTSGTFNLILDIDVILGTAQGVALDLKTDECVDDSIAGNFRNNIGLYPLGNLSKGKHSFVLEMQCDNFKTKHICKEEHIINLAIKGDNFNTKTESVSVKYEKLYEGLDVYTTYQKVNNKSGNLSVKVTNNCQETWVVDLDGGEGSTIPAKTINNITVSFSFPHAFSITDGNNTVIINELKPGETYEFTKELSNMEIPGTYNIQTKVEAPSFKSDSSVVKVVVSDSEIDAAKIKMASQSKIFIEKLCQNIEYKTENSDIINARNKVKQYIVTNRNNKNINVPDEVYDAFAMAILGAIDSSKLEKYESNPNKLAAQIYDDIAGGMKNDNYEVEINGCTYEVSYHIFALYDIGVAWQDVKWTDENGKRYSVTLSWENGSKEEGKRALAEYCATLAELNKQVWKDFTAYFFSDAFNLMGFKEITKNNVSNVLDVTEKVIYALCDKGKADDLIEEIGGELKKELSSLLDNEFKKYVKKNVPNGDKIVDAAEKYEKAKKKYDKWAELWDKDSTSDKATKAYEQFEEAYNIFESVMNSL